MVLSGYPEVAGSADGKEDPDMKRCLFVDDSSVIRKVAKRILGSDMIVVEASTGVEAAEICADNMPDVIVIDGGLTDIQAVDLIRRIRAIEAPVKPQILVSLVEVDVAAIMRAKRAGAQGYLLKPFNRAQLLESFRFLKIAA
ncbi:Response regulator receiver protein [Mesorhizobium plurifarium]|jgi:two-component system chemotaxis response regulator CheY|uniref:Response regulator receiver protein n=2 Tax=Mesorhizobium TaxID=68287 RepID=A0A090GBY7_MESPL|nr:Response regulator receiver protein [Mesorhizobium plurifarium]CDX53045.1 Response regulator receiver protein [Mesorhizobium plurifarium]CDX54677.1 Response regulator receiver protein [Mesorhizobium plurifarium]